MTLLGNYNIRKSRRVKSKFSHIQGEWMFRKKVLNIRKTVSCMKEHCNVKIYFVLL